MRRAIFALVAGVMATLFVGQAQAAPPGNYQHNNYNNYNYRAYSPSHAYVRDCDPWRCAPPPRCAPPVCAPPHQHADYTRVYYGNPYNNGSVAYRGSNVSFWFGF